MQLVSRTGRRNSAPLEVALLACCVALGSAITVFAFGGEVAETYGSAAARLPRKTWAAAASDDRLQSSQSVQSVPDAQILEPRSLAVHRELFGIELADLLDDRAQR